MSDVTKWYYVRGNGFAKGEHYKDLGGNDGPLTDAKKEALQDMNVGAEVAGLLQHMANGAYSTRALMALIRATLAKLEGGGS